MLLTGVLDAVEIDVDDDKGKLEEEDEIELLDEVSPDDVWEINVEDGLVKLATTLSTWVDVLPAVPWLVLLSLESLMRLVAEDSVEDPDPELARLLLLVVA